MVLPARTQPNLVSKPWVSWVVPFADRVSPRQCKHPRQVVHLLFIKSAPVCVGAIRTVRKTFSILLHNYLRNYEFKYLGYTTLHRAYSRDYLYLLLLAAELQCRYSERAVFQVLSHITFGTKNVWSEKQHTILVPNFADHKVDPPP